MPIPSKVDSSERERICEVLVAHVAAHGYRATSLESVFEDTKLDQAAFDRHFSSFDACVTEVWEELTQQFLVCTGEAYASAGNWRDGMRAAAWAYCRFLQEDHERARFLIELSFGNDLVQANRDFVMDSFAELVHLGRLEREQAAEIPRASAEGIVGAIWERIAKTVMANKFEDFPKEMVELMYLTVLPYLGPEAAQEELRRGPEDIARYRRGEL